MLSKYFLSSNFYRFTLNISKRICKYRKKYTTKLTNEQLLYLFTCLKTPNTVIYLQCTVNAIPIPKMNAIAFEKHFDEMLSCFGNVVTIHGVNLR